MKLPVWSRKSKRVRTAATSGFTLVELMVSSSVGILVAGGVMVFAQFAGLSLSGITSQNILAQQAGNTVEFIQSRVRLATSVGVDPSGNVLTLGFDDDPTTDSDRDGIPYNDKDHFEQFQFQGVNGSTSMVSSNTLIYMPKTGSTNQQVLISAGVHNLPGSNIFSVTNPVTVIIHFGIVDGYARAGYHSIDIQATAVPLNR